MRKQKMKYYSRGHHFGFSLPLASRGCFTNMTHKWALPETFVSAELMRPLSVAQMGLIEK